ncbi:shikimate dehydrogenase family protein [Propionivibrio soli]|uniref:shikimate dehydrogenase family protein n=1 Tax=Propionivibrio soli TaxID=2976531 RepID=UPI0021E79AD1|nr:shikimate dehydrogenase [Propionivibrio soli]
MITGTTQLLPLFGYPTYAFKAPLIYNPWFEKRGIDAVVVPMGVKPEDFPDVVKSVFQLTNVPGALVTMPHKITTAGLVDDLSTTARVAGSCNAIARRPDGSLFGDMFDGTGFTRGLRRKGFEFSGARCLVVGAGGVGCAIAASLAAEGVAAITVFDAASDAAAGLVERLREHYPQVSANTGPNSAVGQNLVVNATPLGMPGDPLPIDVRGLSPETFVGEVVMKQEITPLLEAAQKCGCRYQVGVDMLYEMVPAYLEFFGFGSATPSELRAVAQIRY